MTRSDVAGCLLIGSFVLWLPAAVMPPRVWRAPFPERRALIADRERSWRLVNISIVFVAWSYLANAAVIGFGAAVVHSGYPAAWCGWAAVALAALIVVQLLATGDALPALYHVGPALIGVALLSS